MVENKLTMSKDFLDLMGIKKIETIIEDRIDYRHIVETFESEKFIRLSKTNLNNHMHTYRTFPELMQYIEDTYGRLPKLLFWFGKLIDCKWDEEGSYAHLFNNNYLTTDECQRSEYYDLDLLKNYGDELSAFISEFGINVFDLREHFSGLKIAVDGRTFITCRDKEHADNVKRIRAVVKESLDSHQESGLLDISENESSFDCLVFENDREGEILNVEEVKASSSVLENILSDLEVDNLLFKEFKELAGKCFKKTKMVELYLCEAITYTANTKHPSNIMFFSDMTGHPKYVAQEFEKTLERYYDSNKTVLVVETDSPNILDIIRYHIFKENLILKDDIFKYRDNLGSLKELTIKKDGSFYPTFPSGFYDITLNLIYELNRDKK